MEEIINRINYLEFEVSTILSEISELKKTVEILSIKNRLGVDKKSKKLIVHDDPLAQAGIEKEFANFYLSRYWGGRHPTNFSPSAKKELQIIVNSSEYRPQVQEDENLIAEFSDDLAHFPRNDRALKKHFLDFLGQKAISKKNLWAIIYIMRACRRHLAG